MSERKLRDMGEETAIEVADVVIDNLLDSEVLKDLPIVGWSIKIAHASNIIRDRIFLRKVVSFFGALRTSELERGAFRNELAADEKLRKKVGEVIMVHLETLNDLDKPEFTARVYDALLASKIDFDHFRRLADAIELGYIEDLRAFATQNELDTPAMAALVRTGLINIASGGASFIMGDFAMPPPLQYESSELGLLFLSIMRNKL